MNNVWAIILAAGKSTRMQKQKLLLPFNGETIIEKVVKNAVHTVGKKVVVVLGSHGNEIKKQISKEEPIFCINQNYDEGMLSSVICGFRTLPEDADAAIIFLGDQPHIPASVPLQLIQKWNLTQKGIVIPTFEGKRGHPVLIETKYKSQIEHLDQEQGLRNLMEKFSSDICETACNAPEIIRDIDTPSDYYHEINKNK